MAKSANIVTEIYVLARSLAAAADEKAMMAFAINTMKGWTAQECCLGLGLLAGKVQPAMLATVANVASQLTGKLCGPDMQAAQKVNENKRLALVGKEAWWVVPPVQSKNPLLESLTAEQLVEMDMAKELIRAEMAKAPELEMDDAVKTGMLAALADGRWDSYTAGVQENIERVENGESTVEPKVQTFEEAAAEAVADATAEAEAKASVLAAEEFAMATIPAKAEVVAVAEAKEEDKPMSEEKPKDKYPVEQKDEKDRPFRSDSSGAFRLSSRMIEACTWSEIDFD